MSVVTQLIKGGAWLTIASLISKIVGALSLPILARLLGPEALGIYSIVSLLVQSGRNFSGLGVDIALHRNGAQYETVGTEAVGRLFGVGLALVCLTSIVTALGVWFFREPLSLYWLGQPGIDSWLAAGAIIIVLQPLGDIPLLFLASLHAFRAYAIRSSVGIILGSGISVLCTWKFHLNGAILGLFLTGIVQIIWSYLCVKPVLQQAKIRLRFDHFWKECLTILKFGFPYYFGNTLLGSIIGLPLMGLVSKHSGLEELGYLRVAISLGSLVGFIPAAIAPATLSYLSSGATDTEESSYLKSVHLRIAWIITLTSASVLSLVLPTVVNTLFGSSYQGAILLTWLNLWLMVITCISDITVKCLVADGKTMRVCWVSFLSAAVWGLSCIVLVPSYGALGFLVGRVISLLVMITFTIHPGLMANSTLEDLNLLRNLTLLTIFLLAWTLLVSTLNFHGIAELLLVITTSALASVLMYAGALHSYERVKLKKLLTFKR